MECPKCEVVTAEGSRFCENCGARLETQTGAPSATALCRCGAAATDVDAQGFCTVCGMRRVVLSQRDHKEIVLTPHFAAVTDRGKKHPRNEDDVTLAIEAADAIPVADLHNTEVPVAPQLATENETLTYVIVVCDGVSSSQSADTASAVACNTAQQELVAGVRAGAHAEDAMAAAIRAAHQAVCGVKYIANPNKDSPETTIVAAVVRKETITVGWVGDSRAYWIAEDHCELWTHDHSWVNDMVDSGQMTEEEAQNSRQAHAITMCLGAEDEDSADGIPTPSVRTLPRPASGLLLLCTDGLWNYASTNAEIEALMRQLPDGAESITLCRHLVDFANAQGGRDNITVAALAL